MWRDVERKTRQFTAWEQLGIGQEELVHFVAASIKLSIHGFEHQIVGHVLGMFCGLSSQVFFLVRFWSVVVSVVFAKGSLGAVGWVGCSWFEVELTIFFLTMCLQSRMPFLPPDR